MNRLVFTYVILYIVTSVLMAQDQPPIYINEFLASNVSIEADIRDYDDYSDWIELYNDQDSVADISGYFITDDLTDPYKWQFPDGATIPVKGFLRLWADGYDDIPGNTYNVPYYLPGYPRRYFTTHYYHLNFSLSQAGESIGLFGRDSTRIDSVTFELQERDISMGRQPDGSANWWYFSEPTPGASNSTNGTLNIQYTSDPEISLASGFYTPGQVATITASGSGAEIRYTLDGSKPGSTSTQYDSPLNITETTILKVRVFDNDKLASRVLTRTYFIDEQISIPVISITCPPYSLWDDTFGIYDNIYKDREIPVHFEFFEDDGSLGFNLDAGLSLTGQLSVLYDQKSFTIRARERYGTDIINYRIFPQRELDTFSSLYLRNAGVPDHQDSFFRDALMASLVLNKTDLDCQAYRPAVVFLNGAYWGIYNIRDKINEDYIGSIHNLNPEDVDLLEYENSPSPEVMSGNSDDYNAFYEYINTHDLSVKENYDHIAAWMDMDEYINYQITEIYCDNVYWLDQNIRMWRERSPGSKWRWILFDTDFGFGMPNQRSIGYMNNTLTYATSSNSGDPFVLPQWATLIFRKLLQNDDFKVRFLQRFSSFLNTVFQPDSVLSKITQIKNVLSPEMPKHISKWRSSNYGFPIPDYNTWLQNVNGIKNFATNRPTYQRQHLINYFGLSGQALLNLTVNDTLMGRIKINQLEWQDQREEAVYFKGIPTVLEAIPNIGYRFVKWDGIADEFENPLSIIPLVDSLTITAIFEPVSIDLLPAVIASDTTLNQIHSPYYATQTVTVDSNVTLTIGEGVQLLMPEKASLMVHGRLLVQGSAENPVRIDPNDFSADWGALCLVNTSDSSVINYLTIKGATKGVDYSRDKAALSGYQARFSVNHLTITNSQAPVFVQFGKVTIRNSRLYSEIAGDLINIKKAASAVVENCDLRGNNEFDTDAIDFDHLDNGIIRDNRIYNFYGFNSDAIDLGEGARDILVENNIIYNINDKGVSIGGGSMAMLKRNLIANCGQGVGIKDEGSYGYLEHNTFYGNTYAIACFEKNIGVGGGSADMVSCILSNSKNAAVFVDALSTLNISYSLSDTEELPGLYNTLANPAFVNNLHLAAGSPAINTGNPSLPLDPDGSLPDIGAYPFDPQHKNLIITEIHYNPAEGDNYEFIEIVNAGDASVNLNGFQVTGDIHFIFPDVTLFMDDYCVVAKNMDVYQGQGFPVFSWDQGNLPAGPGNLYLKNFQGDTIDFVNYDNQYWWPEEADGQGPSLELHHTSLENMVTSNWRSSYAAGGTPGKSNNSVAISGIYINEFLTSNSTVYTDGNGEYDDWIEIYNDTAIPVNLGSLYITDNLDIPFKYPIPNNFSEQTTIPANGYLILWADGQTDQGVLHLPFKLDKAGEQIGVVQLAENDTLFIDSLTYAEQLTDVSYGRYPDGSPNWQFFNNPTPLDSNRIITTIQPDPLLPLTFGLSQNYPNPFNPKTIINYELVIISDVDLSVYDLLGQKVATLVSERKEAGYHQVEWDASKFASGIYFYRVEAGEFREVKKMVLLR
jgi:hypothetical protein